MLYYDDREYGGCTLTFKSGLVTPVAPDLLMDAVDEGCQIVEARNELYLEHGKYMRELLKRTVFCDERINLRIGVSGGVGPPSCPQKSFQRWRIVKESTDFLDVEN